MIDRRPPFGPGELPPSEPGGDLATSLATGRELEALAAERMADPGEEFTDRVMAAIATEPVPQPAHVAGRALRVGAPLALLGAFRDAWRVTFGQGYPARARAQGLALVLIAAVGVGALTTAGGAAVAGALGVLDGDRPPAPPTIEPSPLSTPSPLQSPSVSPSPTVSPTPSTDPTRSPAATATPEPTETVEPDETDDDGTDDPDDDSSGPGSGDDDTAAVDWSETRSGSSGSGSDEDWALRQSAHARDRQRAGREIRRGRLSTWPDAAGGCFHSSSAGSSTIRLARTTARTGPTAVGSPGNTKARNSHPYSVAKNQSGPARRRLCMCRLWSTFTLARNSLLVRCVDLRMTATGYGLRAVT